MTGFKGGYDSSGQNYVEEVPDWGTINTLIKNVY